jgi:hypothetical protein
MNTGCLANLRAHHAEYMAFVLPDSLTATIVTIVLFAAILAVAVAPLVLRAYGGQVRRLMRLHQVAPPPKTWYERLRRSRVREEPGELRPDRGASLGDLERAAKARRSVIKRATWIAYAVFVVGAPAILWTGGNVAHGDVIGFYIAVPVLAAVPALVNIHPQGSKKWIFVAMIVLGFVLGVLEPSSEEGVANAVFVPLLLGALYLVTGARKLRTVVVVMTIWLTMTLAGVVAAGWFALPLFSCINAQAGPAEWALAAGGATIALVVLAAFIQGGNRALHLLSWLHEGGFASDISLAAGLGFILTALLIAFAISIDGPFPKWQVGIVAGIWIGATLGTYAWVIHRSTPDGAQRSLLLLRVFSKSRRAERFLDTLQARWRYIGPLYEIAGPDLARLNVDASELEKFLTHRLHEAFLFAGTDDRQLADCLDSTADREGRFRVNEVFCLDSAWRETVGQLMRMSDAIVLDVRGFDRGRLGTGFEIELLARSGLLRRVLALGDATTDWELFDGRIQAAGCVPGDVARAPIAGKDAVDRFLRALMGGATERLAAFEGSGGTEHLTS